MNVVILTGRLTREPELKYTPNGKKTCTFALAVDREMKDSGADFPQIVTWEHSAEFVCKYMTKGTRIAVRGRIRTRDLEKDGTKHYVTEVVADRVEFADGKKDGQATAGTGTQPGPEPRQMEMNDGFMNIPDGVEDEGLPFN